MSQQQTAVRTGIRWHTELCDCCEDASSCCFGFWCCPCLACRVAERFGEDSCLVLCDICSPAIFSAFGIPLFVPPGVLSIRSAMRNRFGIRGTLCDDIIISCFCGICSWCQMYRELKHRRKTPIVINVQHHNIMQVHQSPGIIMQNPPVMQMQPAPMMMGHPFPPPAGFVNPAFNGPR